MMSVETGWSWICGSNPARPVAILLLATSLGAVGCGRTVNDYLREVDPEAPETVVDAIEEVSTILERKEKREVPFDEGDRAGIAFLRKVALESPFHTHRAHALLKLARLESFQETDLFLRAIRDSNWHARLEAVKGLRRIGDQRTVPGLVKQLDDESRPEVRVELVKALGKIGGEEATECLFELFLKPWSRDTRGERTQAFWALRRLTGVDYQLSERTKWVEEYEARFGAEEKPAPVRGALSPVVGGDAR